MSNLYNGFLIPENESGKLIGWGPQGKYLVNVDPSSLTTTLVDTDYEESVRVVSDATEGNISLSALQTIQGVALADGDRVLLTAQSASADNRIWIARSGAWDIAEGWDVGDSVTSGRVVPCEEGDNAGSLYVLSTPDPITLGTTSLSWTIQTTTFISNFIGRNVSGASLTLDLTFAKNWIFATRAGNQTITIPLNATARFDIGTEIVVQHDGSSGTKTIQCVSASVFLNGTANGSVTLTTRGDGYILKKKSGNAWTALPCIYDPDTLKADTADNLTAGFTSTAYNAGTQSSGTYTPNPDNGNLQRAVNGGAHTLAVPSVSGGDALTMVIQYTNNASAGTITTSGYTLVDGDTLTTTDGHDFMFYITRINGFSVLTVKALQ